MASCNFLKSLTHFAQSFFRQPVPWQLKLQTFLYQLGELHKVFVKLCKDELFKKDKSQMLYPEPAVCHAGLLTLTLNKVGWIGSKA